MWLVPGMFTLAWWPDALVRTDHHLRLAGDLGNKASAKRPGAIRRYHNTFQCMGSTMETAGIRALYAGLPITLVSAVLYRGLYFGGYSAVSELLPRSDGSGLMLLGRMLAAQVCILSTLSRSPADLR